MAGVSIEPFAKLVKTIGLPSSWEPDARAAIDALFSETGRYPDAASKSVAVRAPAIAGEDGVPYAALIQKDNPSSGGYTGMSVAVFPSAGARCLITFVVGTNGISPDDEILGNPGHARKVQALCTWLNAEYGRGNAVAWAKSDPVRIDQDVPESVRRHFDSYPNVFGKYGKVLYGVYAPPSDDAVDTPLKAVLDLMFEARGFDPRAKFQAERDKIKGAWQRRLLPDTTLQDVVTLLRDRKYVILQGPPGTGKTRLAGEILDGDYAGNGTRIQFHPNTTYESFVGGLSPKPGSGDTGLYFVPTAGHLMQAVARANANPSTPYLLHIDEINRADISKILGEAIYLLEARPDRERRIELAYEFESGRSFALPNNLHILGTMNTSDRSLAIVDVAVRRRFSFINLWPQAAVVQDHGGAVAIAAFDKLLSIFIDHANGDAFNLVPGHSYFLTKDDDEMKRELRVTLVPLLQEYLSQGYVSGFSEDIRAYLQWIDSL